MASGEWVPLYLSIGMLVIVGAIIPMVTAGFDVPEDASADSVINPISDWWSNGFLKEVVLEPLIPGFIDDYITDALNSFSIVPNALALPMIFVLFFGFFWTIWRAIVV